MLKLHFYNHKTLRHLKKQNFYHCCKCCLCKAYSPDTFQTHLVVTFIFDETTPKPRFDHPAFTKSLNFFNNRSLSPINTEKRNTKRLLTCPAVYHRVVMSKKDLKTFS